jgi:hypothetical protein
MGNSNFLNEFTVSNPQRGLEKKDKEIIVDLIANAPCRSIQVLPTDREEPAAGDTFLV